jgi:hypothetical protein
MHRPERRDWVLLDQLDDANPFRQGLVGEYFAASRRGRRAQGLAVVLDHDGAGNPRGRWPVEIRGDRLRVLIGGVVDDAVILDEIQLVHDIAPLRWFGRALKVGSIEHTPQAPYQYRGQCGCFPQAVTLHVGQGVHGSIDLAEVPDAWRGRRLRAAVTTYGDGWASSRPFVLARR